MRAALAFIFVCALLVFAWARRGLPKDIGQWKARAWDINQRNPSVFYSGMIAASKYKSSIAAAAFFVAALAFGAFLIFVR
jgi:hypothetical protein